MIKNASNLNETSHFITQNVYWNLLSMWSIFHKFVDTLVSMEPDIPYWGFTVLFLAFVKHYTVLSN